MVLLHPPGGESEMRGRSIPRGQQLYIAQIPMAQKKRLGFADQVAKKVDGASDLDSSCLIRREGGI